MSALPRPLHVVTSLAAVTSTLWIGSAAAHVPGAGPKTTVRLCVSMPVSFEPNAAIARGVYRATVLATERERARFARAGVTLASPVLLDYGRGGNEGPSAEVRDARRCLARPDTFAYIGPLNSGVAFFSEPVLNRGGMATISPSTTSPDLTDPRTLATREPRAGKLGYVTFYRTVAHDDLQGPSASVFLQHHLHAQTFYLVDDGGGYGLFLASGFARQARTLGLKEVGVAHLDVSNQTRTQKGADSVAAQVEALSPDAVYCGCDGPPAAAVLGALRERGFGGSFVGGDAILSPQFISAVGVSAAARSYATNVGLDPSRSATWFQQAYVARFRAPPQGYDASAFDAASIALGAIYNAVTHDQMRGSLMSKREAVTRLVAHSCYVGATGPTAFDKYGDTKHRVVTVYSIQGTAWAVHSITTIGKVPSCS